MAGVAAGGPSAKTANPQVLPGGLATPGVHIHRWYEARSHHGGSRFDDRGIVRREHQQRSAHASSHAEGGARQACTKDGSFTRSEPSPATSPTVTFSKQWLEAKRLAGIPESVVLYCARHRFSTDAMEGTGNVMAVMDAMGHGSVNTTRIYTHSNVQQIREAIERRNRLSTTPVEAVQ